MSVYPDKAGLRWWTKAWFNKRRKGEPAVEIEPGEALHFLTDAPDKDEWLEEYFPKQMEIYHGAMEKTKQQILEQINMNA